MLALLTAAWLVLPLPPAVARDPEDPSLRSRSEAYIASLNSGDSSLMEEFFRTHFTPGALASRPLPERLRRSQEMREELGTLTTDSIIGETTTSLTLAVTSSRAGGLLFEFTAEPTPPHRLLGIRIERPEPDDGEDNAGPAPDVVTWLRGARTLLDSLSDRDAFSGVLLLAHRDSILLLESRGPADREAHIPNTTGTRFNIGSINKSFTRIAIHQLEARGLLSLDDTLARLIPGYPNRAVATRVTVRQLLEMRSGIPDFFNERYPEFRKEDLTTLSSYLPLFADLPLEFEPGTRRRYSNGGYIVLGLVIEALTHVDYYTYVREHVLFPAGMADTGWPDRHERGERVARGYTGPDRRLNEGTLPQRGSSAGGGYSTAYDLLRFVSALENGILRHPEDGGGLGIAGGAPGLNAAVEWDRPSGYVIIVLSNLDPPAAESLARNLRRSRPRT